MNTNSNDSFMKTSIQRKMNYDVPFFATESSVTKTQTDFDSFPYTKWYRGIAGSSEPIIIDRKAGFRPRTDECYETKTCPENVQSDLCFQFPCSTVLPCHYVKERPKCLPLRYI